MGVLVRKNVIEAHKGGRLKSIYLFGQLPALQCCSRNED